MQTNDSKEGLTINIPSPKYYDMFVSRLIEKNILATQPVSTHQLSASDQSVQSMQVQQTMAPDEQTMDRPTTPTPFDISGPKPT